MFNTDPNAKRRYAEMIAARTERLTEAFKVSPDTGHKPGHKYDK